MEQQEGFKLIAETLKFYADEKNYDNNSINLDKGHMARHSLELVKKIEDSIDGYTKEYEEYVKSIEENKSDVDIINELTNLSKEQQNGR